MMHLQLLDTLNLKKTPKRRVLIEILAGARQCHSPEELWLLMRQHFARIGLPTVYRNLEELCAGGVVSKIFHPDRKLYYAYCPNKEHHHHFLCLSCRKVEDLPGCAAEGISDEITRQGSAVLSHIVQINGLCRDCIERESSP